MIYIDTSELRLVGERLVMNPSSTKITERNVYDITLSQGSCVGRNHHPHSFLSFCDYFFIMYGK